MHWKLEVETERLRVALETMRALHVYESVEVEAAARIQQIKCEQLEQISLAFKRKMDQGKGQVFKLREETVMNVVVTGTRSGCENKSCGKDGSMFLEQSPVAKGPLSPHSDPTQCQQKIRNSPQPVQQSDKCRTNHLTVAGLVYPISVIHAM